MQRPSLEVARIFGSHGQDYRQTHPLTDEQQKAMRDIEACRTARLGGHVDTCTHGCGYMAISYNSCRNRHCPKCQSLKQARWFEQRRERLLPVRYFHIVVTFPHETVPLTLCNREVVFNLFFGAASRALVEFARSYERLQAQIGFTAVLHTWDQDLNFHPHLHIVVTAGGLSLEGDRWINSNSSFLLPVKALSKIIRAKVVQSLREAFQKGKLKGKVPCLNDSLKFNQFARVLKRKKWVVYCKEPFGGAHQAYRYISRYTHRVAISNHRLVSFSDGKVTFRARDNHHPGQHRLVTLTAQEFIRRFLLHILPARFVKIRHFGLMAPCNAKTKLERARALIPDQKPTSGGDTALTDSANDTRTWQQMMRSLTGMDFTTCPQCGKGRLARFRLCGSHHLAPPVWDSS